MQFTLFKHELLHYRMVKLAYIFICNNYNGSNQELHIALVITISSSNNNNNVIQCININVELQ